MPRSFRAAALLAAALFVFVPAVARADDSHTVTVVGTSDVSDSGLMSKVIEPGFEAAFPQYDLRYSPMGTGAAINSARAGNGSALIVHAASLENAFVGDGFSNEQFGRAVFWGDYVLLGPASDPGHVAADAPHDIVAAFEKIAAAGEANAANFVGRGGAPPPGTGVEEHLIWALTNGVATCDVSAANGGGKRPSTVPGPCGAPGANDPAWYHETGAQQGPNIDLADTCNFAHGDCYVLTDRGTFQFKQSGLGTGGTASHLHVVTRSNDAAARGGENFLVNSFHAYAVNPAKVPGNAQLNVAGATAFLNWLTSPAAQAAVNKFLADGGDPPFFGSAAPTLTGTSLPATVNANTPVTVSGNLANVVPGTPKLAGQTISIATSAGTTVASGATDAAGHYAITFTPQFGGAFSVSTGQIAQIEDATLSPVYGDLLAPASAALGTLAVQSSIAVSGIRTSYRRATVSGTVAPGIHADGIVTIEARKSSKSAFAGYGKATITGATYSVAAKLPPGKWEVRARFDDAGRVLSSVAAAKTVTVPGASSAKIGKASADGRTLRVSGSVSPAPATSGAYVKLLGRHGGKGKYTQLGKRVKLAKKHRSYSFKVRVGRTGSWQLRVEYVHKGAIDSSTSKTRKLGVK